MEFKDEDFWSYPHKIESLSLRKCPYDHKLKTKRILSAITVNSISKSFYLQDGRENQLAKKTRYGTK